MPLHSVAGTKPFQMNYEVAPNTVPTTTLFIHGNLASNRWWYPAEQVWKRHAQGKDYKGSLVYAEFRGCGGSSAPANKDEVDMHLFAEDFISLARTLSDKPINLVGHSTGGTIVALMLAKAPELFNKAILLDPVGATGVKFDTAMIAAFEQMKVDKNLTAAVIGSTIHNNNPDSDFFKQVVIEDAFKSVKTVGHWVLQALDGLDIRKDLQSVANQVLVLHGEFDTLLPVAESQAMAKLFQNGQFKTVPGQGHCANAENPELFVKIAEEFLF